VVGARGEWWVAELSSGQQVEWGALEASIRGKWWVANMSGGWQRQVVDAKAGWWAAEAMVGEGGGKW